MRSRARWAAVIASTGLAQRIYAGADMLWMRRRSSRAAWRS